MFWPYGRADSRIRTYSQKVSTYTGSTVIWYVRYIVPRACALPPARAAPRPRCPRCPCRCPLPMHHPLSHAHILLRSPYSFCTPCNHQHMSLPQQIHQLSGRSVISWLLLHFELRYFMSSEMRYPLHFIPWLHPSLFIALFSFLFLLLM